MVSKKAHWVPYAGAIALLFMGVVLPLILFGMFADEVMEKEAFFFDQPVLMFFHAHATPFLDKLMYCATTAGSVMVLIPVNCIVFAWLIKQGRRPDAVFLVVAVIGAEVLNYAAKHFFGRVRPSLWISRVHELTFSFPSGHAMASMATVAALCMLSLTTGRRRLAIVVGSLFVALVGVSRVYFGVHYPSDVLAGWAASFAWVFGSKFLLDRRHERAFKRTRSAARDREDLEKTPALHDPRKDSCPSPISHMDA